MEIIQNLNIYWGVIYYLFTMCYLKNLVQEQASFDFDNFLKNPDEESSREEITEEENVLMPCSEKFITLDWSEDQQKLINLFSVIQKNNSMINSLSRMLGKNSEIFEKNSIQSKRQESGTVIEQIGMVKNEETLVRGLRSSEKLLEKLFGNKSYQYKLKITEEFSDTLYKERNFNLGVVLVDQAENIQRNFNILNICFAVTTDDGEWILENRVGQPFMKGKTEAQLINGEGQFKKLYPRDISRGFPGGKVNIAVYCKPSTLMYSNPGALQAQINYADVQPLLIENVVIKAKKKE